LYITTHDTRQEGLVLVSLGIKTNVAIGYLVNVIVFYFLWSDYFFLSLLKPQFVELLFALLLVNCQEIAC